MPSSSPLTPHASPQDRPAAILLMGPTASGKTGLALELARHFPVEIVSVDSALVYRRMDIGTAKPDLATRLKVPHHLIDIIDPTENYSAAQFCDDALEAMRGIVERERVPMLTGGTMLYFKALQDGLSDLPAADADIRMVIDAMAVEAGWPAIYRELERIDPATAERLDPNDAQRIQRAMEIFYLTGKPMSELIAAGRKASLPYPSLPSMRCVGYRQAWQYLDGEFGLRTLRDKAVAATRQLAKRQLTWLRAMQEVKAFDCLDEDLPAQVGEWLRRNLGDDPG